MHCYIRQITFHPQAGILLNSMNGLLRKCFRFCRKWLLKPFRGPRLTCDPSAWNEKCQQNELSYHLNSKWRQTPEFMTQTKALFDHFGFDPNGYRDKIILDLGAGSMLRTKFFNQAKIIALEPLANRFLAQPWSNLSTAYKVIASPAEEFATEWEGKVDLLVSINVLDHCFNLPLILLNIRRYLKPEGLAFISFDQHDTVDEMHPLVITTRSCERTIAAAGLHIERHTKGAGKVLSTYGHGSYCLNYWLRCNI